ncbi:MAG: DoxX family protein [bacterium]|nr:DoxX family protein [bacterium]
MLNVFPDLLNLGFFAPLLLRLALGVVFLDFGRHTLGVGREQHGALFEALGLKQGTRYVTLLGLLEIGLAVMLIIGLYTQIAALVAFILSLEAYYLKGKHGAHIEHRRHLFFLIAVISFSLLLTGAGALAFDLPL